MAAYVEAFTTADPTMAQIETEFQANWVDLDFMKVARKTNAFASSDLVAGGDLRLYVRMPKANGVTPIWKKHEDGDATIPAKFADEWDGARWVIGEEYSGLVVWASAAATVTLSTTDLP